MVYSVLDVVSVILAMHCIVSLRFMLYAWETEDRLQHGGVRAQFSPPKYSFSVMIPARHEEAVIYETIHHVWNARYPHTLLQVLVVCHVSDLGTIAEAERAIREISSPNVTLVTFSDPPINKPHGLNTALEFATKDIVTVFDAEDDMSPEIFNVINSRYLQEDLGNGVIQAGVQLMNYRDQWFGLHNCLEYFFWFKSRLHLHAQIGMIPLGGNTLFIPRTLFDVVGGWDETCLTEDAEIGIRISLLDCPIKTIYDSRYATREEIPHSLGQFIRQRTRWNQGFLQVLRSGAWRYMPRRRQRLLAFFTLAYPLLQSFIILLLPLDIATALWLRPSALAAMITFLPFYALLLQLVALVIGSYEFAREYDLKLPWYTPLLTVVTYLPFLAVLAVSSVRALVREARGHRGWEKTTHAGAHRQMTANEQSAA